MAWASSPTAPSSTVPTVPTTRAARRARNRDDPERAQRVETRLAVPGGAPHCTTDRENGADRAPPARPPSSAATKNGGWPRGLDTLFAPGPAGARRAETPPARGVPLPRSAHPGPKSGPGLVTRCRRIFGGHPQSLEGPDFDLLAAFPACKSLPPGDGAARPWANWSEVKV